MQPNTTDFNSASTKETTDNACSDLDYCLTDGEKQQSILEIDWKYLLMSLP